jgi:hypothetical protein
MTLIEAAAIRPQPFGEVHCDMAYTDMTDEQLRAHVDDRDSDFDSRSEAAYEIANRARVKAEAEHAAFHGRDRLNYGRVGRRRGYLGETVCLDCYRAPRGKAWR